MNLRDTGKGFVRLRRPNWAFQRPCSLASGPLSSRPVRLLIWSQWKVPMSRRSPGVHVGWVVAASREAFAGRTLVSVGRTRRRLSK